MLDISLVTKFLNTRISRILVFCHCPLITNFHVMVSLCFFDYINTKSGIYHTITLNLRQNIEIFENIVFKNSHPRTFLGRQVQGLKEYPWDIPCYKIESSLTVYFRN